MTGDLITWNESLMTGVSVIDEQHQILVGMLNDANARLTGTSSREVLQGIVRELISYALYHFDTEEEMMVERGYPEADRERHFAEHRGFSEKVESVQQGLAQGHLITRDELLGFLNQWLLNHILKTDRLLGAFICGEQDAHPV